MSVTEFWLKRASELAAMNYRECKLLIGQHRVNQLTVVGVAAEVVWKKAFHERRPKRVALSATCCSDACSDAPLRNATERRLRALGSRS